MLTDENAVFALRQLGFWQLRDKFLEELGVEGLKPIRMTKFDLGESIQHATEVLTFYDRPQREHVLQACMLGFDQKRPYGILAAAGFNGALNQIAYEGDFPREDQLSYRLYQGGEARFDIALMEFPEKQRRGEFPLAWKRSDKHANVDFLGVPYTGIDDERWTSAGCLASSLYKRLIWRGN
jgi:hypothetical protein